MKFKISIFVFAGILLFSSRALAIENPFTITVDKGTNKATVNVTSTVGNIVGTTSISKATGNPIKVCQAVFSSQGTTLPCEVTGLVSNITYYITVNASGSGGSTSYQGKTSFELGGSGGNGGGGGGSQTPTQTLPVVKTSAVRSISQTAAVSGGTITSNGGSAVTSSGIVWGTSANPTTALSTKNSNGWASGGPWTSNITGLTANTTYHVRAFAKNSIGTSYGSDVTFKTLAESSGGNGGSGGGSGGGNSQNYFDITVVPSATSVAVSIKYTGPQATPSTVQVSCLNNYYKDANYTGTPGIIYKKTFTGLTPNDQCQVFTYSLDTNLNNNPLYSNKIDFIAATGNSGGGSGGGNGNSGGSGNCRLDANGGFPMDIEAEVCTPETITIKVKNNTSKLYSLELKVTDGNGRTIFSGVKTIDLMGPGEAFGYTFKNTANQVLRLTPGVDYYITYISWLNGNTPGGEIGTTNRVKLPLAGGPSYFSITSTPTSNAISMNVFYAGFKQVGETITVTDDKNTYFKEESYTAKPNETHQTVFTGLSPDSNYEVKLSSNDPEEVNNSQYQKTETVKTGGASGSNTGGGASGSNTGGGASGSNTGGTLINTGIKNPLGSSGISDIQGFIKAILEFVVIVGIPILTLAIIYTGFLFVTAQGNKEKLSKAKTAFVYVMVGGALILGAFVITKAIKKTVDDVVNVKV